jgi:hypothetical protein
MSRFPSSRRPLLLRSLAAAAALAVLAAPGQAQAPKSPPDFHATVALAGFEQPVEIRQSGLRRRVEVATGAVVQSFISDRTRGALIVMTAAGRRRLAFFFPLPREETNPPLPLDFDQLQSATRLTRMGGSSVAGRGCTLWRYAGYLGRSGVACASPDGVVLQFTPDGRKTPLFQVLTFTPGRQEASWFVPPPDYQTSVLPGTGGFTPAAAPAPTPAPAPPPKAPPG